MNMHMEYSYIYRNNQICYKGWEVSLDIRKGIVLLRRSACHVKYSAHKLSVP